MQNKMVKRIMVALMCGAIAASSASVATFACDSQAVEAENDCIECRGIRVVQPEHGRIEVDGILNRVAVCGSTITVRLIPDEGYVALQNEETKAYFTTGSYADWEIEEAEDGSYTFKMPWCDEHDGVEISAIFVEAE